MQYFGGKQRIADKIAAEIQLHVDKATVYIEPFVGSGAVMCKIRHPKRVGADRNMALIVMWKALATGWVPPFYVSEELYQKVKAKKDPHDPLTAFVGFGCSYAGKWFGGYARSDKQRNFAFSASNSLHEKLKGLDEVHWIWTDYRELIIPPGAVVYCDPPYNGTTQYGAVGDFDTSEFWKWAIDLSKRAKVFVSEYKTVVREVATFESRLV